MKAKVLKLGLLMCFGFINLQAQDSLSVIGKFIQNHPWTMDFGIASNLTLSNFQGSAIALSKFVSDYQKYRIGISTYFYNNSGDQTGKNFNADTLSSTSNADRDRKDYSVNITIQYLTYATPAGNTSIYFGIGPVVGIAWYKNNSNSKSNDDGNYISQYSNTSSYTDYSVGVLGSCGVEWFFSEHISVHAEYGLVAKYFWGKQESNDINKYGYINSNMYSNKSNTSSSSSGWSLSGQNVLFGLSVNF